MSFGLPAVYEYLGTAIPDAYFSWRLDVARTDPRDSAGSALRDQQGFPVENMVTVYADLPAAVFPPSVADQERFQQRGETLKATVIFRRLTPDGALPDVRHQDRLTYKGWPGGPAQVGRYWEVLEQNDIGEAGLLREAHVAERREGAS